MRYDPLNQAVARILESGLLGAPLHAFFENYAGDTPLGPGHWFWNPEISGGIFIEHGVHFFDLFRMWFGPGQVVAAQQSERPVAVSSTRSIVPSATGVCCSRIFTTASTSPAAWSRRRRASSASAGRSGASNGCRRASRSICSQPTPTWICPLARAARGGRRGRALRRRRAQHPRPPKIISRRRSLPYPRRHRYVEAGTYGCVVRSLLADQIRSVDDPQHLRLVSEENGLTSLEIAVEADELTRKTACFP